MTSRTQERANFILRVKNRSDTGKLDISDHASLPPAGVARCVDIESS